MDAAVSHTPVVGEGVGGKGDVDVREQTELCAQCLEVGAPQCLQLHGDVRLNSDGGVRSHRRSVELFRYVGEGGDGVTDGGGVVVAGRGGGAH